MSDCCSICGLETSDLHKHHVTPKSKGGSKGETIRCCFTCSQQIHMLFSNKELSGMSLSKLLKTDKMKSYIKWRKKHPGDCKHRMSRRVKRKRGRL